MHKIINQQDMKDINLTSVFRLIHHMGAVTRRQIEATLGISWGAVSGAVATLLREEYIKEVTAKTTAGAGRTPIALAVNPDNHFLLGLDVNRSGLSGVVINRLGEVQYHLAREAAATDREGWMAEIKAVTKELLQFTAEKTVDGIGLAMQGAVDAQRGISANFPADGWQDVPLAAMLSEEFGYPVYLAHDPDCILYAATAQQDLQDAVLLRVDKGIGMAVMLDGSIFERFGAFELGYTVADGGKRLDDLITEHGLAEQAHMPFPLLLQTAMAGNAAALSLFENMANSLAAAIVNMAQIFHIRHFLLCGKMMAAKDLFLPSLTAALHRYAPHRPLQVDFTEVEQAAVGAALLAGERTGICTAE